jgi:AraC-like DNA-binding protein
VGDGLRSALRYQRLLTEAVDARWREAGDVVRVSLVPREPAFQPPRHAVEFGVASLLLVVRAATQRPLAPRQVAFRHAKPDDDSEARAVFSCPLTYGAKVDEVAFARADLDVPQETADPYLLQILHAHATQLEGRLAQAPSFAARVRQAVADAMLYGDTTIGAIAARLRLSPRSLQRRLHEERTRYKDVVDGLRRDLALRHLEEGKLTQQEIAFVLGFSEQSAFQHAFVRWTGRSPGAYRRRQP